MRLMHRVEGWAVRGAFASLRALGPVRASNLGGAIARTVGPWLPVSRVADINLRLALPALDAAARRRVVRGVWDNLGRTAAELPHVAQLGPTPVGPGWELQGADIIDAAMAQGRPVICVGGHFANWEVMPAVFSARGYPMAVVYRAPGNAAIDDLLRTLRTATAQGPLFPKGATGARALMRHLKSGGGVGILVDQKMNDGIEARLFGRPAMTAPATAALALRFKCVVVAMQVVRLGPARFHVAMSGPVPLPDGPRPEAVAELTQTLNDTIEAWARAAPESWLWLHRRWPKAFYLSRD